MHNRTPYLLFYVQREAESKIKQNYSLDTTDESDYYDLINTYSCDVNDEIIDKINLLPRDTTMISIVDFNEKNNLTSSEDINGVFEDLMDYSSVSGSFSASIDSVTKKRKPKKQSLRNRNLKIKLQKQEARKDPIKYQFWYSAQRERLALIKAQYPLLMKAKERIYRSRYRLNLNKVQKDIIKEKDNTAKINKYEDPEQRDKKREIDNASKAKKYEDPEQRAKKQEYDNAAKAIKYADPEQREKKRECGSKFISTKRANNPVFRSNERDYDRIAHMLRRLNEEFYAKELAANRERRKVENKTRETLIDEYENGIMEGPTNICVCCGGLFFMRTTQLYNPKSYPTDLGPELVFHVKLKSRDGQYRICKTCHKYAVGGKLNRIALSMGLDFPKVPGEIRSLNDLEERLCSPRIPFITIRPLEWDGQQRIKGSCVNVPTNRNCFTDILPRQFEETETIQLKLMRKMNYNNPYMYDTVSPAKCLKALDYLQNTELFKEADIKLVSSFDWSTRINANGRVEFIIDRHDLNERDKELNASQSIEENNQKRAAVSAPILSDDSDVEDNFIANNTDFINEPTMLINTTDLIQKRDLSIAPAEGCLPLSILYDKYAEELAFLKIYAGEKRGRSELDLGLIYKSEFRRYDRRCAKNLTKLFFSYKKLMAKRLVAAISISMNKTKLVDRLTKEDVTNKDKINKMLKSEDADLIFRAVRSTPHFWKWKLMELNAMIRQLGCPTFFITFSPSEVNWYELISVLYRVDQNIELTTRQCASLKRETRLDQIRNDPVTSARYFQNRMTLMMAYLQANNGPFKDNPIKDYFWRVDFQYRGSPHVHMMVWLEGAPLYETRQQVKTNLIMDKLIQEQIKQKSEHKNPDEFDELALVEELENSQDFNELVDYTYDRNYNSCVNFIDKYITAKRTKNHMIRQTINMPKKKYKNDHITSTPNGTIKPVINRNSTVLNNSSQASSDSSLPNLSFTIKTQRNTHVETINEDIFFPSQEEIITSNLTNNPQEKMATLKFQQHKHRDNCTIRKTIDGTEELFCKYNFPFPILDKTIILEPLDLNDDRFVTAERNNVKIRKKLEILGKVNLKEEYDENTYDLVSLNALLTELNLNYDEYILALRSSINKSTVFLKRNSAEVLLNNYNTDIFIRHRANMDIQFITDPYGCATYVSAYLLKSNAVMSGLMQKVSEETRLGSMSHRQRLNKLASCFHSGQEVGAPEATYGILSMPVVFASRSSIYINTFRNQDRHLILKKSKILELLHKDSQDIYQAGLLDHYANRPDNMDDTCLADFATNYEYISNYQCNKLYGNKINDRVGDAENEVDEDEYNKLHRNDENESPDNDQIHIIANELRADELVDGRENVGLDSALSKMHQLIIQQPLENNSTESNSSVSSKSFSKKNVLNNPSNKEDDNVQVGVTQKKTTKKNIPEHYIELKNKQGFIRPREKSKFFRYKKFNRKNEKWDHYRAELMLYLPWRDDLAEFESLPQPDGTFELYEKSLEVLLFNKAKHEKVHAQHYDRVWEEMEEEIEGIYEKLNHDYVENLKKAQEILMTGKNNDFLPSIQDELELLEKGDDCEDENLEKQYGFQADFLPHSMFFEMSSANQDKDLSINVPDKLSDPEYYQLMSRLNKGQHKFVMNFMKAMRKKPDKKQFIAFVGGGAGKGKSFLISAIYQTYIRYRAKIDMDEDIRSNKDGEEAKKLAIRKKTYAVICAPTGKAAFNVTGVTCHSLLSIRAKEKQFGDLTSSAAIKRLTDIFKDNPLVICDEINMVGANMLYKMNRRLLQIMNENGKPFGGLDFIGFGDLFQAEPVFDTWLFNPHSINSNKIVKAANPYEQIVGSRLWNNFKFFELTEIMRQKDDLAFAKCLHNLGELGPCALTDDQVKMLNSRIMSGGERDKNIPVEALHLFYTNQDVDDFNKRTINNDNKIQVFNNEAVDVCRGKEAKSQAAINFLATINQHKLKQGENLSHSIAFKIGIKYMLMLNDDIRDGLYNGAIGVLKHIVFSSTTRNEKGYSSIKPELMEPEPLVKRVYLQFYESPTIGQSNRIKKQNLFKTDRIDPYEFGKNSPLTVIEYQERKMEFEKNTTPANFELFRKQFPLFESEAITINKAEGQTYTKIGVSLKYNTKSSQTSLDLPANKLYVALSRVTKLSGLYLYGRESILSDRIRKMTKNEKKIEVEKKKISSVNVEMKRLRSAECRLTNHFQFLDEDELYLGFKAKNSSNKIRLMFTNICYFNTNKRMAIESDHGFMKCDMILLCETHSYIRRDRDKNEYSMLSEHILRDYETIFKTGTLLDSNASHGQMCFVKKDPHSKLISKAIRAPTNNVHQQMTNSHLLNVSTGLIQQRQGLNEMWEYNVYTYQVNPLLEDHLKIMCVYKHPCMKIADFMQEFRLFLSDQLHLDTSNEDVVIIGDFNIDFNKRDEYRQSLKNEFGLYALFDKQETYEFVNTKHGFSQLDWCFTNLSPNHWNIKGQVYESWFTDHLPIVLEIEKINNS